MATAAPIETRFWSKVERRSPDECWPWLAAKDNKGYGVIHFGSTWLAHRVSWMLAHGRHPHACVCHTCDNPICVNPDHLWIGTQADNMRDKCAKGRHGCSRRTHCPHGHEYNSENTRIYRGMRYCRACDRARSPRKRRAA